MTSYFIREALKVSDGEDTADTSAVTDKDGVMEFAPVDLGDGVSGS